MPHAHRRKIKGLDGRSRYTASQSGSALRPVVGLARKFFPRRRCGRTALLLLLAAHQHSATKFPCSDRLRKIEILATGGIQVNWVRSRCLAGPVLLASLFFPLPCLAQNVPNHAPQILKIEPPNW